MGRHMTTVEQTTIWDRYEAGESDLIRRVGRGASRYTPGTGSSGPGRLFPRDLR